VPRPEPMPHASINRCHRVGDSVTKAYAGPDAAARQAREETPLRALADRLPVATVLDSQPGILTTAYVDGLPGQELISDGRAEAVLFTLGRLLDELQSVPPGFLPTYDGTGVLVHHDFGPSCVESCAIDMTGRESQPSGSALGPRAVDAGTCHRPGLEPFCTEEYPQNH